MEEYTLPTEPSQNGLLRGNGIAFADIGVSRLSTSSGCDPASLLLGNC